MSTNDLMVLRGRVGTGLTLRRPEDGGRSFVRFRMVTPRPRRKDNGEWEDGEPQWYTVRAWGSLAENLAVSLHKGQPVVVVGRPAAHAWISPEGELRSELAVNAVTVGHDLGYGVSLYSRLATIRNLSGEAADPTVEEDASTSVDATEEGAGPSATEVASREARGTKDDQPPSRDDSEPSDVEEGVEDGLEQQTSAGRAVAAA